MNSKISIPEEGLYVSKKDTTMRLVVTDVDIVDDEEEDKEEVFFLVTVVREGDEDDMSAPAFEYIPEEWQHLVKSHQLEYIPEENYSIAEIRELLKK
ncbi:hypothetical protein BTJ39_06865 [Izhakiella australiensis]|uniref:DUF1292 domain-containing protein n=1 Tax=Izhakiella australiensis TaxID=1926881 RepID=A0A1S8YQ51_9GAMM|nr:hypothetical protein [Izhakiella australiensis]OON40793.1 hypothetical protein BTJ39_06865 [Izhakiella australiensis]